MQFPLNRFEGRPIEFWGLSRRLRSTVPDQRLQRFAVPNPITLRGNLGRNTLIGPGLVNFDFSLFKNCRDRRHPAFDDSFADHPPAVDLFATWRARRSSQGNSD